LQILFHQSDPTKLVTGFALPRLAGGRASKIFRETSDFATSVPQNKILLPFCSAKRYEIPRVFFFEEKQAEF
jgi:hypothetical protein